MQPNFKYTYFNFCFIAGNGRSKEGKKAKSDPQAEIEELKPEKRKLEEEIKKLKEKVDNLEEALRRIEAEREEESDEEEELRWKFSKSTIFTNSKSHTILRIDLNLLLPGCCSNFPVDRN